MCIEMNLLKKFSYRVWIGYGSEGFWQKVTYERVPKYCTQCLRQGHDIIKCKSYEIRKGNPFDLKLTKAMLPPLPLGRKAQVSQSFESGGQDLRCSGDLNGISVLNSLKGPTDDAMTMGVIEIMQRKHEVIEGKKVLNSEVYWSRDGQMELKGVSKPRV